MIHAPRCRHCNTLGVRRRGLCWQCYATPTIRRQYPSESIFARGKTADGPAWTCRCSGPERAHYAALAAAARATKKGRRR